MNKNIITTSIIIVLIFSSMLYPQSHLPYLPLDGLYVSNDGSGMFFNILKDSNRIDYATFTFYFPSNNLEHTGSIIIMPDNTVVIYFYDGGEIDTIELIQGGFRLGRATYMKQNR
uniref:hypothetical protein n=1 Tax=Brachyspira catarrhinii TaxID=2528966 RepID=UPI003F4C5675